MKLNSQLTEQTGPYLKGKEVAKLLKISYTTLISLVKKGLIPSYRIGTSVRYKASDVEEVVKNGYRDFLSK